MRLITLLTALLMLAACNQAEHEHKHAKGDKKGEKECKDDELKKYAAEVGLDAAAFEACLTSNKYADRVEADRKSGEMVGVSGTPAFFINGVFVNGARPFEAFAEVIDAEIKLKKL